MRFLYGLLPMLTTLAIASALPQDWSGPKPMPVGVCGVGVLYQDNIKGDLRDDSICYQVTGDIKSIKVFKGCICGAWNTDNCGGADPSNGLKFVQAAFRGDISGVLKQEDHARWYRCQRF